MQLDTSQHATTSTMPPPDTSNTLTGEISNLPERAGEKLEEHHVGEPSRCPPVEEPEPASDILGQNQRDATSTAVTSPSHAGQINGVDNAQPESEPPQTSFPPLRATQTTTSSRAYSSFSKSTKLLIVAIGGVAGIFSPISSNIFVPAIPTLATAFHKTDSDISQAVTIYLIFQALTPSIFGSMSDSFGRRPIYIGTLVVYLGANIGLALCPTSAYWLLLVLRALQATGGSAVISIGYGCVADVAEPRERGKYAGFFQLGAMAGPAFGPFLGGVLTQGLGWRSIFWFLAISTGVVLVPLIFFLPETLRSMVGDGSIPPPALNASPIVLLQRRKMEKELKERGEEGEPIERPPRKPYQPLSAFTLLFTPEIFLSFVFASLPYLEFYSSLTVYSTALKETYGLSEIKIGLCYLPSGIATILTSQINGRQLDWYYRKEEKRVGGDYRKKGDEFQIDWTRLRCLIPFTICLLISCIAQGWCLQAKAPLAVTLVFNFFIGLGGGTIATVTVYGQDIVPGKGGAVSASLNLVRCIFGAVGVACVQSMYSAMGAGWTFVVFSGISIIAIPLPILVIKRGRVWRENRARKEREKKLNNTSNSDSNEHGDSQREKR